MKKLITLVLLSVSFNALALDDTEGSVYNPHSYGAPTLYYSPQGMKERRESELLKESYGVEKARLEMERQKMLEEKRYQQQTYGNE